MAKGGFAHGPGFGYRRGAMSTQTLPPLHSQPQTMELSSGLAHGARRHLARADLTEGLQRWRLACTLGWLDIRLRYRGSVLGPLWLTLSTGVMVGALGLLYSTLFRMDLHEYLPFLALSLVLWNFVAALVGDACLTFTGAEGTIRSIRMPFTLYAVRVVVRNFLILAHNLLVVVVVFAIFRIWPGWHALLALPAVLLWVVDCLACCLLLGAFCARFRDIPPIVGSVMQIGFFVSPVIWKPELVKDGWWLPLNPFYTLLEVVRGPLLGTMPDGQVVASALAYSALLCVAAWVVFTRVRGRVAFWV
jgi:lipopolysaccharide transport system permease protein